MISKKHIAFICPRFPDGSTVGGAETLLKNIAIKTAASVKKVTFLTTCAKNHFTWVNEIPTGSRTVENITVHFFPVDDNRDISAFLHVQKQISTGTAITENDELTWLKNNINSSLLYDHLYKHGDEYDIIVAGPYLFGLIYFASLIHPSKTILVPCLHDEAFAYLKSFKKLFGNIRGFMFNTEPERDLAYRLYNIPQHKTAVVGIGLDPFDADKTAFSKKHNLSVPYIIYSGRREPLKGTPLLIDYLTAFRNRTGRDVKLVLTGTGQINIPQALTPHVTDLGFVSEDDKYEAMAGAVAFCHPSINESLGIVILEAWMAKTPAIVHKKSEVLRYQCLKSNGGLWFQNYPEFEEELILLLDNSNLKKAMGKAGREYVLREYSWKVIEKKLSEALSRLS